MTIFLQGFKTILVNLIVILAAWLNTNYGIVLDGSTQAAIAVSALAIINIGLRIITKTAVFKKQ